MRDGRDGDEAGRAETLKRSQTGSRTVAYFDPSVGGERVTVHALAAEGGWVLVTRARARAWPNVTRTRGRKERNKAREKEGEREKRRVPFSNRTRREANVDVIE